MRENSTRASIARWIPVIEWLPRYRWDQLPTDVIAGMIVAVMLVPQSMAYAVLAGLPPQAGLYASILPLVIYGLLGTSRSLSVGPTAIASLLTASAVGSIAMAGTDRYIEITLVLTLMVGVIRVLMGLLRAGFVVNFLSHPVLSGFINAAAIIIATSQIDQLLGLNANPSGTFVEQFVTIVQNLSAVNLWTAVLGIGSVVVLLYFQKVARRHFESLGLSPDMAVLASRTGTLLTVALATVLVWLLQLDSREAVVVVGSIPSGLPSITIPGVQTDELTTLAPAALIIALVGFMESISVAKSLASRERERVDADQELIAIGAANVGAAFTGGFTVSGSPSRSVLNYVVGGRSGVALITTAMVVLATLLVLTPLFYYLPFATISAIVLVSVTGLFEVTTIRRVWSYRRGDAATLIVTFLTVLTVGIEIGLLAGIVTSIVLFLWRTSHPNIVELGRIEGTDIYRNVNRINTEIHPRILILRIDESLYFANTQKLQDEVMAKVHERRDLQYLVLVGSSINDIDSSALESLEELVLQLRTAGVTLHLAAFKRTILNRLRRTFLLQMIGDSRIHLTVNDAVSAIRHELDEGKLAAANMTESDVEA